MEIVTKFIDPTLLKLLGHKEIERSERWYCYLSYNGKRHPYLQTQAFTTTRPSKSRYRATDRQLPIRMEVLGELLKIDQYVKANVQLPVDAPAVWRTTVASGGSFYRHIDPSEHQFQYITIEPSATNFNSKRERVDGVELTDGQYRCLILVKGVYFGAHGTTPKFASLHLRNVQLMYTEQSVLLDKCLFVDESDDEAEDNGASTIDTVIRPTKPDQQATAIVETMSATSGSDVAIEPRISSVQSLAKSSEPATQLPRKRRLTVLAAELPSLYMPPLPHSSSASSSLATSTSGVAPPPAKQYCQQPQPDQLHQRREELTERFLQVDYRTQDATEEELDWLLAERARISQELTGLLGADWEVN